ncbi:unnamed protein product [Polarella glacialis]|uniref:Protein kinase domain-containing protein n=1 Tax=Polarella glacialis TaxID=89957 RepID=A0A813J3Y6_POLGL|nr:unnamed protein product [Polarella glacialis]
MAPELMMRPANEKTDSFALGVVLLEILTRLQPWDQEGMALTDRAVSSGHFEENLLDADAQWPLSEGSFLGKQAVTLTFFDPSSRQTVAALEQGNDFKAHLQRADQLSSSQDGSLPLQAEVVGAAS